MVPPPRGMSSGLVSPDEEYEDEVEDMIGSGNGERKTRSQEGFINWRLWNQILARVGLFLVVHARLVLFPSGQSQARLAGISPLELTP